MAFRGKTVLAVVPARGGSKGIPRKNLREVGGRSLIAHAAACARALDWIDSAIASTDDEEIAAEARASGLDVPFMRPAELAGDLSTSADMWRHAWTAAEAHYGMTFDISVLLEPTSPMRLAEDITRTVDALIDADAQSAVTVTQTPGHYTPERTLKLNDAGRIRPYLEGGLGYTARQMVPAYYHRNGVCYAVSRSALLEDGVIIGDDTVPVVIKRPVVNIDDPLDLDLVDFLMRRAAESEAEAG